MKLAAVLQLIDAISGQAAIGTEPRFLLNGQPVRVLPKAQAFYAFSDLADGTYELDILFSSARFFSQRIALHVPFAEPLAAGVQVVELQPGPIYPYPEHATLISGCITSKGAAIGDVTVSVQWQSPRKVPKSRSTRSWCAGRLAGRYVLALPGNLAAPATVALQFDKPGLAPLRQQLDLQPASTHWLDIDMPAAVGDKGKSS